jgi:hypothetical protein
MNATMLTAAVTAAAMTVSIHAGDSLLLELTRGTTFIQGCFDPCACPISLTEDVSGTMVLKPRVLGGTVDIYDVIDVDWQVGSGGAFGSHYTGSGTYTRFKEVASLQQLELDLATSKDVISHFDSGMVPIKVVFPQIDITISINGMFCFDTVFHVVAAPVEPDPADLNGDGHVDGFDLGLLLGAWGPCPICIIGPCPCLGDLNGDMVVDGLDLGILLGAWG